MKSGIFIAPPLLTIQELNKLNLNNITFENNIVLSINKNYIIDNNNFKPNFIDKIKKDYDKILKTELYSEFYTQYNEFFNVSLGKKTKKTILTNWRNNKYQTIIDKIKYTSNFIPFPVFTPSEEKEFKEQVYLNFKNINFGLIPFEILEKSDSF